MIRRRNFLIAHEALHELWTQAVGTPGYDKRKWQDLDNAIYRLATDGPGDVLPAEELPPSSGGG